MRTPLQECKQAMTGPARESRKKIFEGHDSPENLEAEKRLDLVRHVCGLAMPMCALAMYVLLSSVAFDPTPKSTLSVAAGVKKGTLWRYSMYC